MPESTGQERIRVEVEGDAFDLLVGELTAEIADEADQRPPSCRNYGYCLA